MEKKTPLIYFFAGIFEILSLVGIVVNIYTLTSGNFTFNPPWEPYFLIGWFFLCFVASNLILFGNRKLGIIGFNSLAALVVFLLIAGKIFDIGVKSLLIQMVLFGIFGMNKRFREYFGLVKEK